MPHIACQVPGNVPPPLTAANRRFPVLQGTLGGTEALGTRVDQRGGVASELGRARRGFAGSLLVPFAVCRSGSSAGYADTGRPVGVLRDPSPHVGGAPRQGPANRRRRLGEVRVGA